MARIIAPSMLSADFGRLDDAVQMLNGSRAEWIHIDVMDGVFVPNISFGFPVLASIVKAADKGKVIDTHLMIVEPEKYVGRFVDAGSHCVTFHVEATDKVEECIDIIHEKGARAGLTIKPGTPVSAIEAYLDRVELVMVMSVEPGFGGQAFMPHTLDKTRQLDALRREKGYEYLIEMDGGISCDNAAMLFDAGCDVLVAGSAVFRAPDPRGEIVKMLEVK